VNAENPEKNKFSNNPIGRGILLVQAKN
jgi:hypothetical protein